MSNCVPVNEKLLKNATKYKSFEDEPDVQTSCQENVKNKESKSVKKMETCNEWEQPGLFDACRLGDFERALELLDAGANMETQDDSYQCTPLLIASGYGHVNIVSTLVKKGANIERKDKYDMTPLMVASDEGNIKVVLELLRCKANIEANNMWNVTSLMIASDKGYDNIVSVLLQHKANIEAKDMYMNTSLMEASRRGYANVISVLLQNKANIEARNEDGSSLEIAARYNHREAVMELLRHGANIYASDCQITGEYSRYNMEIMKCGLKKSKGTIVYEE